MILERKLKCDVSREQIEDLKAFHGIDVEAELSKLLSDEINRGIGRDLQRLFTEKPKNTKRIYNDLDPYGEECWEE